MDTIAPSTNDPNIPRPPRITIVGSTTIWLVSFDGRVTNYHCWRGARTVEAIAAALLRESRAGREAHLELETDSIGPTELDVEELRALGVLR
jgi:hypothetical protein